MSWIFAPHRPQRALQVPSASTGTQMSSLQFGQYQRCNLFIISANFHHALRSLGTLYMMDRLLSLLVTSSLLPHLGQSILRLVPSGSSLK